MNIRHLQLAKIAGKSPNELPSKLIASQRTATDLQMQVFTYFDLKEFTRSS
jgi:hypothetical protein